MLGYICGITHKLLYSRDVVIWLYIINMAFLLTDFYKIAKVDEDEFEKVVGDADTLAGMLLEIKGEFPALHEKVTYHNYEFEVLEMDSRRILKVKFTILPKEMEDGVVSAV